MSRYIVAFVTVPNDEEANRIANSLVQEKLVACVNIVPGIRSCYWWQGKVQNDSEILLILKTTRSKLTALSKRVRKLHSYSVPEVIGLPIVGGNRDYLKWIGESLKTKRVKRKN